MIFYAVCACIILSASGQRYEDAKWEAKYFPHPVTSPLLCNRPKPSNVCDPDHVLETEEEADILDDFIQKLYQETPCICDTCSDGDGGIVVGIAILKNLLVTPDITLTQAIRTFAQNLRLKWKLGNCDNDILIVVATAGKMVYTDVGKTTSHYLSADEANEIYLKHKAKFTASKYSEGLLDVLKGYYSSTENIRDILHKKKRDKRELLTVSLIIVGSVLVLGIFLALGFFFYRRYRSKKGPHLTFI